MNGPLYHKVDLDKAGCSRPDCTHENDDVLWLWPKCHQEGSSVRYEKQTGQLVLECAKCHKEVVRIQLI